MRLFDVMTKTSVSSGKNVPSKSTQCGLSAGFPFLTRMLKVMLGIFLNFFPEFQAIVFKVVSENVMPLCYLLYHQIVKARVECFIMG